MTVSLLVTNMMNSPQVSRSNERGTSAHRYSPFGAGQLADTAANILGFNGQRRDPVSLSYHLGNGYRAYNPLLMRFNCPDNLSPFGAGGINPYAYCAGDPINYADPSGHISWQAGVGIGLGILGIIATAGAAAMAISAAGGIGAALTAASTTSLLTGSVGVAADAIGIASGAISDTNSELSETLGWVSMATGIAGLGVGVMQAFKGGRALKQIPNKNNNLKSLINDISNWKDITMHEGMARQDPIRRADIYEVMLNPTSTRKRYIIQSMSGKNISIPDGMYDFAIPSDAPGHVFSIKNNLVNSNKYIGHESLIRRLGGTGEVRYAGVIKFKKGYLTGWNNGSGHYKPDAELSYNNLIPWTRRLLPHELFIPYVHHQ